MGVLIDGRYLKCGDHGGGTVDDPCPCVMQLRQHPPNKSGDPGRFYAVCPIRGGKGCGNYPKFPIDIDNPSDLNVKWVSASVPASLKEKPLKEAVVVDLPASVPVEHVQETEDISFDW